MPMHERAKRRMLGRLATCPPERRDAILDQYLDAEQLATEWDADRWGLMYANEPVPGFEREPTPDELRES